MMSVVCPNCQAENRPGARFCKTCAGQLPVTLPISSSHDNPAGSDEIPTEPRGKAENSMVTRKLGSKIRTGTKPIAARQQFIPRPAGAIFADQFLYQTFVGESANKLHYRVNQLDVGEGAQIRVCPNHECGAIFPPRNEPAIKFCTDCGAVLQNGGNDLILTETYSPAQENILRLASKGLSHGSVRAPLAFFDEVLGDETRYCLVEPFVQLTQPDGRPEFLDQFGFLKAASALGCGLDYLHDNGVYFDGQVSPDNIGWVGEKAVWADFSSCVHHPTGYVKDRIKDTQALARMVYFWLTGKSEYRPADDFPPLLRNAFNQVLLNGDVMNGGEFSSRIDLLLSALNPPLEVSLQSGRCSDVGMVRDLNEDSLMSLEWDHTKKSVKQMVGVYVVADGMGGHSSGEIASGQIIDTFSHLAAEYLFSPSEQDITKKAGNWLRTAVEASNHDVFNLRKTSGTDMGSTLVAAILVGSHAFITHIGDSRAYLIDQKEIRQLTEDHSLVQRMVASHQITREEARRHPQRNVIYRTIGDKPVIDVDILEHRLKTGDYLCLCSDGLSGMVEDHNIHEIILRSDTPQSACDELVKAANSAGGQDNVSVIIIKISKV